MSEKKKRNENYVSQITKQIVSFFKLILKGNLIKLFSKAKHLLRFGEFLLSSSVSCTSDLITYNHLMETFCSSAVATSYYNQ